MQISVSDAKAQLTELVRRAQAGEEVILTRHGHPVVQLTPAKARVEPVARRKLLEALRRQASVKAVAGAGAAASQDFLYDEDGLPK